MEQKNDTTLLDKLLFEYDGIKDLENGEEREKELNDYIGRTNPTE